MEVQIYNGIKFTCFHQGPIFLSLCPLKNTWRKLSLTGRGTRGRKEGGKWGEDMVRGEEPAPEGCEVVVSVWSLWNVYIFSPVNL